MMYILCVQLEVSFYILRLHTNLIDLTEEPSDPELNLDYDSIVFDDASLPSVPQLQVQGMAMMSRAPSKIMQHGLSRTCGHIKA